MIEQAKLELAHQTDLPEDGTDIARLRSNLQLTPTERVQKALAVAQFQYSLKVAAQAAGLQSPH